MSQIPLSWCTSVSPNGPHTPACRTPSLRMDPTPLPACPPSLQVTADFAMREELVLKIAILAEKFAPSVQW